MPGRRDHRWELLVRRLGEVPYEPDEPQPAVGLRGSTWRGRETVRRLNRCDVDGIGCSLAIYAAGHFHAGIESVS